MRKSLIILIATILALCASCNLEPDLPAADFKSGTYDGSVTIGLSCSSRNSKIYYTMDGSNPQNGVEYTGPITITCSCRLSFVAKSRRGVCSMQVNETYAIKGPAGGLVFYDCDADNDSTNEGAGPDKLKSDVCGWRYLEAAPADITVDTTTSFAFGFYRTSDNGSNWYVNGSTTYVEGTSDPEDGKSTGTALGTGRANTAKLVSKMGSTSYSDWIGTDTTANYAAKLCDDCTYGGYSDWFLPSKDELNLMYTNLKAYGLGGFSSDYYWSSSESSKDAYGNGTSLAWRQWFYDGYQNDSLRYNYRVRAVRAF